MTEKRLQALVRAWWWTGAASALAGFYGLALVLPAPDAQAAQGVLEPLALLVGIGAAARVPEAVRAWR